MVSSATNCLSSTTASTFMEAVMSNSTSEDLPAQGVPGGVPHVPSVATFEFVVVGVLLTAVALFGIVANVFSLVIFSRPEMKSSVNCCLQGLAFFDIGVLVCAILMLGLRTLGKSGVPLLYEYTVDISPFTVPILYPVGLVAQSGSVWTTVAVTVERYLAVCHPLKARSVCTHRRARYCNALVLMLAVAYNVPRFFEIERVTRVNPATNATFSVVVTSSLRQNKTYFRLYYIGMYLLFMYYLPFAALAMLNSSIWMTVKEANRDRRLLSRRLQKEFGLAVMLLGVVAVFIVCNVLPPIVNVLEYVMGRDVPVLIHVSNLLVVVNSSANLVVYCLFGHRFKRFFLYLFCRVESRETTFYSKDSVRWTSVRATVTLAKSSTFSCPNNCSIASGAVVTCISDPAETYSL